MSVSDRLVSMILATKDGRKAIDSVIEDVNEFFPEAVYEGNIDLIRHLISNESLRDKAILESISNADDYTKLLLTGELLTRMSRSTIDTCMLKDIHAHIHNLICNTDSDMI